MNGGESIARVLQSHGVEFLFTLCGGHISPILKGAKDLGIRVVDVRHEVAGRAIVDEFGHGPSGVGDDGGPAGHGFDDAVAEGLVEVDEVKECVGTSEHGGAF